MIEQQLTNLNFVGKDGFIWWIGQIVKENAWVKNLSGTRTDTASDHKGFEYRYKVRIMGYHTHDEKLLSDEDLPWASVMYPVTAGSGSGAASQTPNLRQGNFVYGFFLDGENSQVPVIMGVVGYNQYTAIPKAAKVGFAPYGGFSNNGFVPHYSIPVVPFKPGPKGGQDKFPGNPQGKNNPVTNSAVAIQKLTDNASKEQEEDGQIKIPIKQNSNCEPIPLGDIQRRIQNLIKKIQKIQKKVNSFVGAVNNTVGNFQNLINKAISEAASFITGGIKWIITEIQKGVTNKVNNLLKNTYFLIFPNQRPKLKKAVETANDLIACLFRKIISSLLAMVEKFLLQIVDRFINTPLCAVENFVGGLIGKLTGLITSAINSILGPISAIVGSAISITNSIFSIITNILSFLSCDENPECSELKEWSTWGGAGKGVVGSVNDLINKVKSVASTVSQAVDPNNFNFDLDFSDLLTDTCNVGAVFCGPPKVEFIGGGGSGASANAIISAAGEILSADIINSGSGYTSPPILNFVDSCGNGRAATGRVIISTVSTNTGTGTGGVTGTGTGGVTGIGTGGVTGIGTGGVTGTGTGGVTGTGTGGVTGTGTGGDTGTGTGGDTGTGTGGDTGTGTGGVTGTGTGGVTGTGTGGVTGIVIEYGGSGYLPKGDGSLGGDGRTWAEYDQTTVKRSDGTYDVPYSPGDLIDINVGDIVQLPGNDPYTSTISETISAPPHNKGIASGTGITSGDNKYPIVLEFKEILIEDCGFGYDSGDKIVISPDRGAVAVPKFNDFGALIGINLINGGYGFNEIPEVYIESDVGYNSRLIPVFNVIKLNQNDISAKPEINDIIISVVDCVGKV